MKKYNLSEIMKRAWTLFRKMAITFAEALHRAWLIAKSVEVNAERIRKAKADAEVTEETETYSGWMAKGYKVRHGSKALFGVDLIHGAKGDSGIYKARFFGRSQVEAITAGA